MSAPSPDLFLEAALAYQKTASIKAAIALDLFTAIAQEEGVLDRVAARVGAASRGVRILCDYLTVHGFLEKHDGNYSLSPSTALFLTTTSPAWMGSVIHFLCSPEFMDLFLDDPVAFVRNGGSPGLANIAPDNPIWVKFAKAMVPFIAPVAGALAEEARTGRRHLAGCSILPLATGCSESVWRKQSLAQTSRPSIGKRSFKLRSRMPERLEWRAGVEPWPAAPSRQTGALSSISSYSRTSCTTSITRHASISWLRPK